MIAYISGRVISLRTGIAVIETGGIGYSVNLLPETISKLRVESVIQLNTAHIIREDSQTLFGFETQAELETFNLLCSVSGVGPKSALAVLAQIGVDGVARAVELADDGMFKSVTGVGPKTAKLIVLTLTGKLVTGNSVSGKTSVQASSVLDALVGLGYQEKAARQAVDSAATTLENPSEAELLKLALSNLATGRKVSADER